MKKSFLLIFLLLPILLPGCDGNFGLQKISDTCLVIQNITCSEINVFCKSEKLDIPDFIRCDLETDKNTYEWLLSHELIKDDDDYKCFYIPSAERVEDSKNVNISFMVYVDGSLYTSEIKIAMLNNSPYTNKNFIELKNSDGKIINAVFTYFFRRSI